MRAKGVLTVIFVLTAIVWLADGVNGQIVEDGLIAHWTFDASDIEGETAKDVAGGNDGAISGGPGIEAGKIGDAMRFDGVDDRVAITDEFMEGFAAFTVEAWAMPVDFPHDLKVFGGNKKLALEIDPAEKKFRWAWRSVEGGWQAGILSSTVAEANTWYHLVATYDGSTQRLYVNGVEEVSGVAGGTMNVNTDIITIGSYGPTHPGVFSGLIDEVCIYDRALSVDEIQINYSAPAAVSPVGNLAVTWGTVKTSK